MLQSVAVRFLLCSCETTVFVRLSEIYIGWCVLLSICILYSGYFKALQCISILFCLEDGKLSPDVWFENDKQTLSSIKDALCNLSSVVFSRLIFHLSRKRHILANSLLYLTERVTFPWELLHLLFKKLESKFTTYFHFYQIIFDESERLCSIIICCSRKG